MKPAFLTRTILGIVAGLTLLVALISPIPVYADKPGHEPPPPKTPANDLGSGGKKGSSGSPSDDSRGTSSGAAVAPGAAGTPLLLASLLSVDSLEPGPASLALLPQVKFCPQSGPDFFNSACQERTTIEDIITYIKTLDNASGVIYVDKFYSTGSALPRPGLVFDQDTFNNTLSLVTGLDMHGGYEFGLGTQSTTKTLLTQPVTIQNFDAVSHFSMDTFQINISGYAAGDPAGAAVNVINSQHASLTGLDIQETSTGSALVATQSGDLVLHTIILADSGGGTALNISQTLGILLDQVASSSTSTTGFGVVLNGNSAGLTITQGEFNGSTNAGLFVLNQAGDISLDNVIANNNLIFGAAFSSNTGALSISNSQFNGNGNGRFSYDGLQINSQNGPVSLSAVNASQNGANGATFSGNLGKLSLFNSQFNDNGGSGINVTRQAGAVSLDVLTASGNGRFGAAFSISDGDLSIQSSNFDNNGSTGLSAGVNGGAIILNNVSASGNDSTGANLSSHVSTDFTLPGIQVTGGDFSNNAGTGMLANSPNIINLIGTTFLNNTQNGLRVNGSSLISLFGVQANSNGGLGAQLFFANDVFIQASVFDVNGAGGLDLEYPFLLSFPGEPPIPATLNVTLEQVQARGNGDYGVLINAGSDNRFPPVDIFVIDSQFDRNRGTLHSGLTINTFGSVHMSNVSASGNAANGADITSNSLFINNSRFNSNGGFGLVLTQTGNLALVTVQACFNHLGPLDLFGGTPFIQGLNMACTAPLPDTIRTPESPADTGLPWQTIRVFSDANQVTGELSCQMGTTFVYLQKGTSPAANIELARLDLPPCIVPEGSMASFQGLALSELPAPLPDGAVFRGPAFNLTISRPDGGPVDPGGTLTMHLNLPVGFSLPAGKKLAVLWFDPSANQWVEQATFASPVAADAFPVKAGVFVLVVR